MEGGREGGGGRGREGEGGERMGREGESEREGGRDGGRERGGREGERGDGKGNKEEGGVMDVEAYMCTCTVHIHTVDRRSGIDVHTRT